MMNATVLVTGADGFIGQRLCRVLAEAGYRVTGAVRRHAPDHGPHGHPQINLVEVNDIGQRTDWSAVLDGIDGIIHLAARTHITDTRAARELAEFRQVNVDGTVQLATAARVANVKRFIYLSSLKVNGAMADDARGTRNEPVTHSNAIRAHRYDDAPNPQSAYALSKWEAEQALRQVAGDKMECVILRPPLVYGPGVKAHFLRLLKSIARGMPWPVARVNNLRSMIYLDNLADALLTCITHPRAAGRTFLLSDGEDVSMPDLVRRIAAELHRPARLFPFPLPLLRWAGKMSGRTSLVQGLVESQTVDNADIASELDWRPPYSLQQGLRETAAWYRVAHESRRKH